ncbi:proline-rich transmembrane protein 1-like [Crassostrea virginica]|uniref:Proline-rich transmembrane protein 1-like n=1 Tax=Crassostrea virginica TaxID=6565 RepID=A0A8B8CH16_CRAVI|nr:proline-rich transmembrane protein 1-like [Crassostrea virginica]
MDYGDEPPPPYQAHEGYRCPPPYSPPQYPGPQEVDVGGHATGTNPVAPGPVTMSDPPPPDFMNRAIFVTICCFWPTGIFAIMKASESRRACARGDFLSARDNAKSSRQLSNISIMIGGVLMLVTIVVVGLYWFFVIIPNLSSGPDRYR